MSLALNGSTGYLVHQARIASAFPFSIAMWVAGSTGVNNQAAIMQGQSSADRYAMGWFTGFGASKYATLRNPGGNQQAVKTTTPHLSASTMQLMIVVFESTTSRRVYFGSNSPVTDAASVLDDVSNHDRVMIGGFQTNGASSPSLYLTGSVAEPHFFSRALTATDYDDLAGGVLPETLSGWVDGWTLQTYSAGGTYTSLGGGRTLTASVGVSASGLSHPVARGGGDTTAPTLTSPTGASTGSSTATVGATTDEANGTMYAIVSTSSTPPTATQIQAGQTDTGATAPWSGNQGISSTGAKTFNATGLTPSTVYYAHIQHRDAAGNNSTVVISASFTTSASGDTTPPTLTSPTGTKTGSSTATGTVTTDEANGTLYRFASTNATETVSSVKAANLTQAVSGTGVQNVSFTGLTPSTTYYAHYVHRDAAGNDSARVSSASFTTDASAVGRLTTPPLKNNTGTVLANATNLTVNVMNPTTGALIVQKTGLTTDATGVCTFTDAAVVTGQSYAYEPVHATLGRRLPVATAT